MRAAADDLAAELKRLEFLKLLSPIFTIAEKAAGLALNTKKCVLIPLMAECTPHLISLYRNRLLEVCPAFGTFQISGSGKYLGFHIGPEAGLQLWKAPIVKYIQRCSTIAKAGAPAIVAWRFRELRALPVLA